MKMSSFVKYILWMFLIAVMAGSLAGCGVGSSSRDTTVLKTDGTIDTSSHEVITMLVLGDKPTNGRCEAMLKELNKLLTEKVNAELKLMYVEWADWQTQYNVQLLSGDDSLDILTTATDWLYAWENSEKGAFLPLSEEMLKTFAPKTWKQVEASGDWDICKYNGEIYLIPEDHYTQYTNHGMFYRGDWAKEAGLNDGTIGKFEDMTTYFQYVKENKDGVVPWDVPGKNNAGGLLGAYIQSNSDYRALIGCSAGNFEFWYTSAADPYTITSPYMEDDTIYGAADLMKEWNEIGVWREDVLNFDGDTREELYAGTSGADQHHSQTYYSQIKPSMDIKQPGSDVKMYAWGQENKNISKPLKTHGAAALSINSKHPKRALMVYDLLRNDEQCYRYINYGIEGKDYIVTEEGKLSYPEGWDQSVDKLDANFWCGRNDDLELVNSYNWSGTGDMIEGLNKIAYNYEYENLILDKNTVEAEQAAIANVLSEYIPQLAYGKYEDPHAAIDEMREKIKEAGYEKVKESFQKDMDAFKKADRK